MNIELTESGDCAVALLRGTGDDSLGPPFDEKLHPIVSRSGSKLLIDMSGIERVTSAGINHLVTLVSRANTKGSRVVLFGLRPFVKSVIQVTRLDRFFDLAETVEEARSVMGLATDSRSAALPSADYRFISSDPAEGDVVVLRIKSAELRDYDMMTELGQELQDAFVRSSARHAAVDLSSVGYVASAGYLPFLKLSQLIGRNGGRTALFAMTPLVEETFEKTRLLINPRSPSSPFESAPDKPTALRKLTQPSS